MGLYILCPYFKRERKQSITCEDTIRSYPTTKEKHRVLKNLCASQWKKCPYAIRMESIYALEIPQKELKEKIMQNTIESQKKEINNLMTENGKLKRTIEKLQAEIKKMNDVAGENYKTYRESLERKDSLLNAKDENIKWLESLAAAFLVVAYGEDTREVRMTKDKIMKLMTTYNISYRMDDDGEAWVFNFEKAAKS